MIEAPLVGLEWCTNHLLKNHETISQIDYNYIFRGNKLGYAPNRFSYPFLRTVILLFDMKKSTLLRCVLKDSRRGNGVIRKGYTVFPCFKPHLQGFCSFHSLLQSVPFHRELLLSRPHGSELQSEHAFFRLYLSRC